MWFNFRSKSGSNTPQLSNTNNSEIAAENPFMTNGAICVKCQQPKTLFVCTNCAWKFNRGNNSKSKHAENDGASFQEQKKALDQLKKEVKEQSDLYDQRRQQAIAYENLKYEVKEKQRQLELLQLSIDEKRSKIVKLDEEKQKLQIENSEKTKQVSNIYIQTCQFEKQLISRQQEHEVLHNKYVKVTENVEKSSRSKIQQLIKYIFPISTEHVTQDQNTVARMTQDDDWVFYANGINEVQYRIVGPMLPANGNYAAYLKPLEDKQFNENDMESSRNAEYRILGALTYTTQLVQLMYHCLGVRMPQKLTYDVFCKEMNKEDILKKINKLNMNIMYLAYTQNVKMHTMNENHTLENILTILDTKRSDLGRFGFHAVGNAPLVKSVDSVLVDIDSISQEDSNSENEEESESDISFCLDLEDISNVEEMMEQEENPVMTQSFISAAASQITSIFGWMK